MNRHRYRIIFNNARNTWVAVAEIARSRGKSTSAVVNSADEVRGKTDFLALCVRAPWSCLRLWN